MRYSFKISPATKRNIHKLEIRREAIKLIDPGAEAVDRIRREALLKSALYSAKIEGNPLTESEVFAGQTKHNREVQQLLKAYERVMKEPVEVSLRVIKRWHEVSMAGLDETPGHFRHEQTAIFNQAGVAVYMPPPASEVSARLTELVEWQKQSGEPAPVKAAVAHFWFEKIHPFVDGNGQVGRLLAIAVLGEGGYGFSGMMTLERTMEEKREEYYSLLAQNGRDVSDFVDFYIDCLVITTTKLFNRLKTPAVAGPADRLLPRQREIYRIVRDHTEVSFDFIRRRFLAVPKSTLHYDVNQLMKKGLVMKVGQTRGVRYRLAEGPGL